MKGYLAVSSAYYFIAGNIFFVFVSWLLRDGICWGVYCGGVNVFSEVFVMWFLVEWVSLLFWM